MALLGLAGSNVVLNDNGDLAVLAAIDTGGGTFDRAIFSGDTLIVRDGDVLDGKVVAQVKANFDMNDRGDVAFRVRFTDETEAVVLATRIVPEPRGELLLAAAITSALAAHSRARRRKRQCHTIETLASPHRRGGDLSQDRQIGGVSCVCHRLAKGVT
jgi:hypothetical protein